MKQEDKELLLRDLSARLRYNLVVQIEGCGVWNLRGIDHDDSSELRDRVIVWHGKSYPSSKNSFPIINCKPFLFPLSSMTEEQNKELHDKLIELELQALNDEISRIDVVKFEIDYYLKNHFDYLGLIEKGLAIDASNLNVY